MRYTWLDEYLMKKSGVTKNTENWNWVRYMIGGKMFVAVCLDDNGVCLDAVNLAGMGKTG